MKKGKMIVRIFLCSCFSLFALSIISNYNFKKDAGQSVEAQISQAKIETIQENTEEGVKNVDNKEDITMILSTAEIDPYDFNTEPLQMVLINTAPCVLTDETVYVYADGKWNETSPDGMVLQEIYGGDFMTGISNQGEIFCDISDDFGGITENFPLGSAAGLSNVGFVCDELKGQAVAQLNGCIADELIMALLENGMVRLFYNGSEITDVAGQLGTTKVVSVSGNYLLTKDRDVYFVQVIGEDNPVAQLKQISEKDVRAISACGDRMCAGILQNGSVQLWSDYEGDITTDFQNVVLLAVGSNYCVALTDDGKVCFVAYDSDTQEKVRNHLDNHEEKALLISCYAGRIAVLYEDLHICMIDVY